jgi:hypothetical protein
MRVAEGKALLVRVTTATGTMWATTMNGILGTVEAV